jgi:hypothetical protein
MRSVIQNSIVHEDQGRYAQTVPSQLSQFGIIDADFKPADATETELEQIIDQKLDQVVIATESIETIGIVAGKMNGTGGNLDEGKGEVKDVKKKLA